MGDFAKAQIGGTTKQDIKFIPQAKSGKEQNQMANNTFQTAKLMAIGSYAGTAGKDNQTTMKKKSVPTVFDLESLGTSNKSASQTTNPRSA